MASTRAHRHIRSIVAVGAAIALSGAGLAACSSTPPPAATVSGIVQPVAPSPQADSWRVTAYESGDDERQAAELGSAETTEGGAFTVPLDQADVTDGAVIYLVAQPNGPAQKAVLAAVIADPSAPENLTGLAVNERTTVATGFAMAQFVSTDGVGGTAPGVVNSAGMAGNLVDPRTGELADVISSSPNGSETSALPTFQSLVGMLAACVSDDGACATLLDAATAAGGEEPVDTFRAFADIAKNPGNSVVPLFDLAQQGALPSQPGLAAAPDAWTLALRFDGDGQSLDGPGNFAIDKAGNLWVNNNYQYGADPKDPVCSSDELFKFSPTGQFTDGSPYSGGGLSGSGFGVVIDPATSNIWVSNYGFAAPAPDCPTDQQPPHNSVSIFTADGTPLTGDTGITAGALNWPQGTIFADDGSVWFTNCNTSTITVYPDADPDQAKILDDLGLQQPFGIVDNGSNIFVAGTANSTLAILDHDGTPIAGSPFTGSGLDRPMGVAADAAGNVWIANSGAITLPCPDRPEPGPPATGSVSYVDQATGQLVGPFQGGGVTTPWGIATDGDGNVWVADFSGRRLVAFCGADPSTCPEGLTTGDPLSPADTGYSFDGLDRSTGVAVDPSGNVWVTNNWQLDPQPTNPGGHEIVAFLALAAPLPGT
ncbi:NHL repeat-containing protein [Herbiconiux sp. P17]|uniref:NHL repeat-containing protein n=1 Tax=Herbiconiux wuyangfengii TaxID=3342794 RepID=UPI0035B6F3BE